MIDLLRRLGTVPAPNLRVSAQRLNDEMLAERRRELESDVEYRDRVKRRMLLGYASPDPPLVDTMGRRRARVLRVVGEP